MTHGSNFHFDREEKLILSKYFQVSKERRLNVLSE